MPLDVRADEGLVDRVGNTARNDADGPGRGTGGHAAEDQFQQHGRHRRSFGVMHPIGVAQPLRRAGAGNEAAGAVFIDQILDDGAGLRNRHAVIDDHR